MEYKIYTASGYYVEDESDGNVAIHVVTKDGDVFYAVLFTPGNFVELMKNYDWHQVWAEDMVVVKDLSLETVRKAIDELYRLDTFYSAFDKLGTIEMVYGGRFSYETIPDLKLKYDE